MSFNEQQQKQQQDDDYEKAVIAQKKEIQEFKDSKKTSLTDEALFDYVDTRFTRIENALEFLVKNQPSYGHKSALEPRIDPYRDPCRDPSYGHKSALEPRIDPRSNIFFDPYRDPCRDPYHEIMPDHNTYREITHVEKEQLFRHMLDPKQLEVYNSMLPSRHVHFSDSQPAAATRPPAPAPVAVTGPTKAEIQEIQARTQELINFLKN
jgi:hypothetical protein